MIKRYRLKEYPQSVEVISISDLPSLGDNGFLIIRLNKELSEDEANDITEEIGIKEVPVPCVVSTCEMTVYEVLDEIEQMKALEDKETKDKDN